MPLNFHPWVYIGLMIGTSYGLPDLARKPCNFSVTQRNFQTVLSWKFKNHSIVPTHYSLWYTVMSKMEDMKVVEDCTNITRPFCDLTSLWTGIGETYIPKVVAFRGNTALVNCSGSFFLATKATILDPPDFNLVGFTDHINVTVKFPFSLLKKISMENLQRYLSLTIEQQSEAIIVKKYEVPITGNMSESFVYVIENLIPNTNHCMSVYFESQRLREKAKSPLKCILLPSQPSGSSESAYIGRIIVVFLIVVIIVSSLIIMERTGYICLKKHFPPALNFYKWPTCIVMEPQPLEAVDTMEVICVKRKKKVWNYSYGDESDSEDEAALKMCPGGYTSRGMIAKPLIEASMKSSTAEESLDSDPELDNPDLPEVEAEAPLEAGPSLGQSEYVSEAYKGRESVSQDPIPEEDSISEGSGDNVVFNVDLNSVFMRVLDDDVDTDSPEETVDLEDDSDQDCLLPTEPGTLPPDASSSGQCWWSEDTPSEKSNTSETDIDLGDGYVMR